MSSPLMRSAALASRRRVARTRAETFSFSEVFGPTPGPWTSGMTVTPVSNPLIPNASLGKTRLAPMSSVGQFPRAARSSWNWLKLSGCRAMVTRAQTMTTTLSRTYGAPTKMAAPIASPNPRRKTTVSREMRSRVTAIAW